MIIDVDRIEAAKHLHDPVVLARGAADHQKRMPAAETLGIEVRIFIRHGVPFHGRPVIEIAAVFQQLDIGIIDARCGQGLAGGARPVSIFTGRHNAVALPIAGLIRCGSSLRVDRIVTVHNRLDLHPIGVADSHRHERAAAPHTFGVVPRFRFANTGLCQSANQTASGAACCSHCRSRGEPASSDHRSDTRNGQKPETRKQAGHPADRSANPGAVIGTVGIPIDPCRSVPIKPAGIVVCDDADVGMRNSKVLQLGYDACASVVVFVKPRNRGHCTSSFLGRGCVINDWGRRARHYPERQCLAEGLG
jgi:hypothetical protein